jgi:hypothetical protein
MGDRMMPPGDCGQAGEWWRDFDANPDIDTPLRDCLAEARYGTSCAACRELRQWSNHADAVVELWWLDCAVEGSRSAFTCLSVEHIRAVCLRCGVHIECDSRALRDGLDGASAVVLALAWVERLEDHPDTLDAEVLAARDATRPVLRNWLTEHGMWP